MLWRVILTAAMHLLSVIEGREEGTERERKEGREEGREERGRKGRREGDRGYQLLPSHLLSPGLYCGSRVDS